MNRLLIPTLHTAVCALAPLETASCIEAHTRVALVDGRWHISGLVTYPVTPAEGLRLNFRKPIACNEDSKMGEQGAQAAETCVTNAGNPADARYKPGKWLTR